MAGPIIYNTKRLGQGPILKLPKDICQGWPIMYNTKRDYGMAPFKSTPKDIWHGWPHIATVSTMVVT